MRRLLACAGLALALASCTPGPVAIHKSDFVSMANAICQTENAQQSQLPNPGRDLTVMTQDVDESIALTQSGLNRLHGLAQPAGDAATIAAIFAGFDKVLADFRQESAALHAGDMASARSILATTQADVNVADAAAAGYGMTSCTTQ